MIWGLNTNSGKRIFLLSKTSRPALRPTHTPIWELGALSAGMKWPGCVADHAYLSCAKDMN